MARVLLGFLNWDMGLIRSTALGISDHADAHSATPLVQSVVGTYPVATDGGSEHSRGYIAKNGLDINARWNMRAGAFTARSQDNILYACFAQHLTEDVAGGGTVACAWLHSDANPDTAANGAVRIVVNVESPISTQFSLSLDVKAAGAWIGFGVAGAGIDFNDIWRWWALEVDITGTRARILYQATSGATVWTEYLTWQTSATIAAAGITSLPSLNGGTTSSKNGWGVAQSSLVVCDKDTDFVLSGAGNDADILTWKAMTRVPNGDVTTTWSGVGGCGGGTADQPLWKRLVDIEVDASLSQVVDYIHSSSANENLFTIDDHQGATDIQGVFICIGVYGDTGTTDTGPDVVIADLGGTATQYATLSRGRASIMLVSEYVFLPQKPDGAGGPNGGAWTLTDFNNLRVGVKNTAAPAAERRCYVIQVGVLGAGWTRYPTPKLGCQSLLQMPLSSRNVLLRR